MQVFRIVNVKYKSDLSGTGAYMYGGRWNYAENYMLYAAEHISLALCEILVHQQSVLTKFVLQTIELPDAQSMYKVLETKALLPNWDKDVAQTKEIGTAFLKNEQLLYYIVPSVIVNQENNILINPNSINRNQIKLLNVAPFDVDARLIKNQM